MKKNDQKNEEEKFVMDTEITGYDYEIKSAMKLLNWVFFFMLFSVMSLSAIWRTIQMIRSRVLQQESYLGYQHAFVNLITVCIIQYVNINSKLSICKILIL